MTTLKGIEDFVETNQEICDAGRPATDELIEKAERYLDVRFPDDSRAFLKRWGTLSIGPLEFYGVCKEDFVTSSVPDAIWYTQRRRQQLGPKEQPRHYQQCATLPERIEHCKLHRHGTVILRPVSRRVGFLSGNQTEH